MIHNNLISSKTIIAKVISDLSIPEEKLPISDVREWIMEGLLKIGAVQQYEHKIDTLKIKQHQAKLPCDLYRLGQVAFSLHNDGIWLPMRKATSSFSVVHDKGCKDPCMLIQDEGLLPIVKNLYNLNDDKLALEILNNNPNTRQTLSALLNQYTFNKPQGISSRHKDGTMYSLDLQYDTKPGYIYTNLPCGYVKISYSAIYTDEEGMPMIPDLESYKEAIFWYVAMKLLYPKYLNGEINQNQYYDLKRSWAYYRQQAYGEAMSPDEGEMASIMNNWNKLYPEINERDNFYSTLGQEQVIYNQSY